jgi:hypothetical protein
VDDDSETQPPAGPDQGPAAATGGRPWYRRLTFVVPAGIASGILGLFFVGFAVLLLFLTDRDRHRDVRIGGSVLLLWWLWTWTLAGTSLYIGVGLLVTTAVFLAAAARTLDRRPAAVAGGLAASALLVAATGLFPDGVRAPALDKEEALQRVMTSRRGHPENVTASQADVVATRARFTNRPYYFVVLHERNPDRATTGDGEPCFRRAEIHLVDALDGSARRQQVTEARAEDGHCLPLKVGTHQNLVPVENR